ncbi:putative histone-like transcription factor protein-2 [Elsinoe australis]|uniref:Putative histone-like transcription factor protein-2 n=1 Tax=Elsinoe australis TaxID=40998 RepID=A0A4U7AS09_9PEZI|nr:putative histone-like transcription factor protein-2 [Elsinoe australis]
MSQSPRPEGEDEEQKKSPNENEAGKEDGQQEMSHDYPPEYEVKEQDRWLPIANAIQAHLVAMSGGPAGSSVPAVNGTSVSIPAYDSLPERKLPPIHLAYSMPGYPYSPASTAAAYPSHTAPYSTGPLQYSPVPVTSYAHTPSPATFTTVGHAPPVRTPNRSFTSTNSPSPAKNGQIRYRAAPRQISPPFISQRTRRTINESDASIANFAPVARIMKSALPENAKIAKEAKECLQECVSEFISFITSEASEKCQQEKRKTVNGEDIIFAMTSLGFENYSEALKIYLSRYRETLVARGDSKQGGAQAGSAGAADAYDASNPGLMGTGMDNPETADYPYGPGPGAEFQ